MKLTNAVVSYLTVTENALNKIKELILSEAETPLGIRINLEPKGCSGMKYSIRFATAETISALDELVQIEDVNIFVDIKISMLIIGMQMDYEEDKVSSGFVFKNPNEKGRCGCGESFYV